MDLPKLISETKVKKEMVIDSLTPDQVSHLKKQNLINELDLVRMQVIKEF